MARVLIALGSNLGHREMMLRQAWENLGGYHGIAQVRLSSFYDTEPIGGPTDQPRFLNAVGLIETIHQPSELLEILQQIEEKLGRVRQVHWGPRTIDLDLLLYDDLILHTNQLNIPHPLMHTRRFVLEPAAEIAAEICHPVLKKTISQLLGEC